MPGIRRRSAWYGWISVAIIGVMMVAGFALAGGVGGSHGQVVLADSTISQTTTAVPGTAILGGGATRVTGMSVSTCAGPKVTGAVGVSAKFTGYATLGLFAIEQSGTPLTRHFFDTGQRATANFTNALLAPFTFSTVPGGAPAYVVAVIPSTGTVDDKSELAESQVIPLCNTVPTTVTETTTETDTTTNLVTSTVTNYSTVTDTTDRIVTVTASFTSSSFTFNPLCNPFTPGFPACLFI